MRKCNAPLFFLCCFVLGVLLSGCATIPVKDVLPVYSINGVSYVPLSQLCDSRGILWDYDALTKAVTLTKENHRINLIVGDTLVLVDGRAHMYKSPVDIYQGAIVVPYRFKEEVIDVLFVKSLRPVKGATRLNLKRIVVDAGHGGYDPGAIGRTGLREKDVNLDIVKRLAKLLQEDGIEVTMTRSSDVFVSLPRRVAVTNAAKADLFVSVHSNANRVRSLSGFEVYYVSLKAGDEKRAFTFAQSGAPDCAKNYLSSSSLNVRATLWGMINTYNRSEAIRLGRAICRTTGKQLDTRIIGIKNAGYFVLRGAQIPALLIETGFLSNPQEEKLLKNNYYRQQVAEAIEQGILQYGLEVYQAEAHE